MANIKAIETRYKGHRFRSRLEARWSIVFDELKIKFLYELEGYRIPGGFMYLPDFFLPDFDLHVEVKPTTNIPVRDLLKLLAFAEEKQLLLIVGVPCQEEMFLLDNALLAFYGSDHLENQIEESSESSAIENYFKSLRSCAKAKFQTDLRGGRWGIIRDSHDIESEWQLLQARRIGACARFEHGEQG